MTPAARLAFSLRTAHAPELVCRIAYRVVSRLYIAWWGVRIRAMLLRQHVRRRLGE